MTKHKYKLVAKLEEIRDYEKRFLDTPNEIILDEKVESTIHTVQLYYKDIKDFEEFWKNICKQFSTELERLVKTNKFAGREVDKQCPTK